MSKIKKIILALLCLVFLGAGIMLAVTLAGYSRADRIYEDSRKAVTIEDEPSPSPFQGEGEEAPEEYFPIVTVDFKSLWEKNPEVVGWIYVPNTRINYPLVQGDDNSLYVSTGYNLENTSSGSIFMDYRNSPDFTDPNTIIFGHNMKNGGMFGTLKKYEEQEYFDLNLHVYIFTPEKNYKYRLFSAYKTESGSESYYIEFSSPEKAEEYIEKALAQSLVETELSPSAEDRLIMLSTCTTTVWNQRFVVHGVLVAEQERTRA